MQTVAVKTDMSYQLSYCLKCLDDEALAIARVEWLDSDGDCLELAAEQINELGVKNDANWQSTRLVLAPIPKCRWARISFSARGGQVLLDQVSFISI
ncbi:MAG: hypothetical protein ACM3O9_04835 [Methylocystaceae bacterium]